MRAGLLKILTKIPSSSTAVTTPNTTATQNAALPKVFDRIKSLSPQVREKFEIKISELGKRKD